MESLTGAGSSKRRGQYSSRACSGCRRRRGKCDGVQPTCGTCEKYRYECEWSTDTDARRAISQQLVESLRTKISFLEADLERLRKETDPAVPPNNLVPSPPSSNDVSGSSVPKHSLRARALNMERPLPPPSDLTAGMVYRYIFQIDPTIPIHEQSAEAQISFACNWSRYLPQLPQVSFTRQEHDILLLRCFKYGTSWLFGLVPELFLHDMLHYLTYEQPLTLLEPNSKHYTPLLHCSIMAFACAFSDDPAIRCLETRALFASWAKQWLDQELGRPGASLARSLILLAEYHCGVGEGNIGYMHMGTGFRAARLCEFLVTLYIPGTDSKPALSMERNQVEPPSSPELVERYWHIWSAFSYDKLMALEYRSDYDFPVPRSEVPLPSIDCGIDSRPWPLEVFSGSTASTTPARTTTANLHETCKLFIIASHIIDNLPSVQRLDTIGEQAIIEARVRLDTWFNNLPKQLLVWARSTFPLSHVIILHICYWWLLIVLHQPLYPKKHPSQQDEPRTPIVDSSIKMCDRASHKIVQLITMFDNQHGLRFFPRNMIQAIHACGTMLLLECASAPPSANKKRANAIKEASTCVDALRTISSVWPSARKTVDELDERLQKQLSSFPITQVEEGSAEPAVD